MRCPLLNSFKQGARLALFFYTPLQTIARLTTGPRALARALTVSLYQVKFSLFPFPISPFTVARLLS
jgi:hypothetical protein